MKVIVVVGLAIWCAVSVVAGVIWSTVMWLGKYHDPEWDWQECLDDHEDEEVWTYGTETE